MKKVLLTAAMLTTVGSSFADDSKIKQLEEQIKLLQQQIEELKKEQQQQKVVKEETEVLKEEIRQLKLENVIGELEVKSYYGLGPAASKAMFNKKGVSIGGYGELTFVRNDAATGSKNITDMQRLILYLGYAFNEKLKFNSEIELEHSSTNANHGNGGGYYKTEMAFLDYNFSEKFGVRGGLLLIPIGIINEYHEPPTFPTAQRPFLETRLLLSTWEEMGFGAYGKLGNLDYKFYITNGLMIAGNGSYSSTQPLKNLIQRGARASADGVGFTGKIEYNLPSNLKIGGSFWTGDVVSKGGTTSKLGLRNGADLGDITIISPYIWYQHNGWDIRAVGAYTKVNNGEKISQDIGVDKTKDGFPKEQKGFYTQIAYNIFRLTDITNQELYLFGVYENIDTHSAIPIGYTKPAGHKLQVFNIGFSYKPHPLVALKADYARLDYNKNKKDENHYRFTLGFMF